MEILTDVTDLAVDIGIRPGAAITEPVRKLMTPLRNDVCQDYLARVWELLARLHVAQNRNGHERVTSFQVIIRRSGRLMPVNLEAATEGVRVVIALASERRFGVPALASATDQAGPPC